MTTTTLLDRLAGVRSTGHHRWIARCPAHDDKRPSLSIRELDDGRVLVHDFGGCTVDDVLSAAALDFDALYPERALDQVRREARPFGAEATLRSLPTELAIIVIHTSDVRTGKTPSHEDHERFLLACSRIIQAKDYCDGK